VIDHPRHAARLPQPALQAKRAALPRGGRRLTVSLPECVLVPRAGAGWRIPRGRVVVARGRGRSAVTGPDRVSCAGRRTASGHCRICGARRARTVRVRPTGAILRADAARAGPPRSASRRRAASRCCWAFRYLLAISRNNGAAEDDGKVAGQITHGAHLVPSWSRQATGSIWRVILSGCNGLPLN
jgi:hypothetical protein